jgi:uncharacterized protein (DUF1697 family)
MTRRIALLRGINVGGNKQVPMARLRLLLESIGFTDVATLLQGGNAILSAKQQNAAKLGQKIEKAIPGARRALTCWRHPLAATWSDAPLDRLA